MTALVDTAMSVAVQHCTYMRRAGETPSGTVRGLGGDARDTLNWDAATAFVARQWLKLRYVKTTD